MKGGQLHEHNVEVDDARTRKLTVDELRRQLAAYAPAMLEHINDLPAALKAEAEALAAELDNDLDALAGFWTDLRRREYLLTRDECTAVTYAIWLAIAFWPDAREVPLPS